MKENSELQLLNTLKEGRATQSAHTYKKRLKNLVMAMLASFD